MRCWGKAQGEDLLSNVNQRQRQRPRFPHPHPSWCPHHTCHHNVPQAPDLAPDLAPWSSLPQPKPLELSPTGEHTCETGMRLTGPWSCPQKCPYPLWKRGRLHPLSPQHNEPLAGGALCPSVCSVQPLHSAAPLNPATQPLRSSARPNCSTQPLRLNRLIRAHHVGRVEILVWRSHPLAASL